MIHGTATQAFRALWWEDGGLSYVDRRALPDAVHIKRATQVDSLVAAVADGAIAGARCIEVAGGFGMVLAGNDFDAQNRLRAAAGWRGRSATLERVAAASPDTRLVVAREALANINAVDRAIAEAAQYMLSSHRAVLTLGSTGALSSGGSGTALAAIIAAPSGRKSLAVYLCETRPLCTGQLSAFELATAGISCTVCVDGAAAALIENVPNIAVIVGAAAIARNGDVLAELGTYGIALAAAANRVPLYVATPRGSIDPDYRNGAAFSDAYPHDPTALLDVTPGRLVTALITEYGVTRPPYDESLASLATRPRFAFVNRRG